MTIKERTLPAQDLILLGLLLDAPRHGYELRRYIQKRLGDIAVITPGTIYYTLKKLKRKGLVKVRSDRDGKRPERFVYTITKEGREAFRDLLEKALLHVDKPYSTFDIALHFYERADPKTFHHAVCKQIESLARFANHIGSFDAMGPLPPHFDAIRTHLLAVTRANQRFFRGLPKALAKAREANER